MVLVFSGIKEIRVVYICFSSFPFTIAVFITVCIIGPSMSHAELIKCGINSGGIPSGPSTLPFFTVYNAVYSSSSVIGRFIYSDSLSVNCGRSMSCKNL